MVSRFARFVMSGLKPCPSTLFGWSMVGCGGASECDEFESGHFWLRRSAWRRLSEYMLRVKQRSGRRFAPSYFPRAEALRFHRRARRFALSLLWQSWSPDLPSGRCAPKKRHGPLRALPLSGQQDDAREATFL